MFVRAAVGGETLTRTYTPISSDEDLGIVDLLIKVCVREGGGIVDLLIRRVCV